MTSRPDPESLRELGEGATNASNAWAGAEEYLSQGLVAWTRRSVADDQKAAVKAAVAACRLVIETYPTDGADAHAPKQYIDDMIAKIQRWVDNPSNTNKEAVRSSLDTTRQLHAWQGHQNSPHFWILEAVDHASLSVWAGERSSYIVPLDFATCAARAVACVLHAQLVSGVPEEAAVDQLTGVVLVASNKSPD
ncbi:MAG: hypothetical protein JWP01_1600 [Myxococcales bacterium]|nr:hypothetical protein [Myxococcales bacterium]